MHTQILPYQKNSSELFDHLVHLPYAIFLDSCLPQQNQGRYDIIAADPIKVILNSNTLFSDIKNALNCIPAPQQSTTLPFTVGAIGYLSYDIGKQLENIPEIALDDIQLPKALVGIYDWSIVVDHLEKKTTLTSLYAFDHPKIKKILALLNTKPKIQKPFSITKDFQSNMAKAYYEDAFDKIKKNIVAGNCYQVNFAQRFSAEFSGSPWNAYKLLREKNPAPYSAFINLKNAAILSCSPERFLKVTNHITETKPIKGTSPRFADPKKDKLSAMQLMQSEKDRAENIMIVDLLRNDLSRSCTDVTVQQLCALESFSNVHHLVSTITGKLSPGQTAVDLLEKCFPGGSITGAPKIAAMKIIESLEPHRRSLYCGSIFYADIFDHFDSNILIRTAICDQNKIHCYAGGGIVYDSDCEKEYQETHIKIKKIIQLLSADIEASAHSH